MNAVGDLRPDQVFSKMQEAMVVMRLRPLGERFIEAMRPFGEWSLANQLPGERIDLFGHSPSAALALYDQLGALRKRCPELSHREAMRIVSYGPLPSVYGRPWRLLPDAAARARSRLTETGILERVRRYSRSFGRGEMSYRALVRLADRWAREEIGLRGCFMRLLPVPMIGAAAVIGDAAFIVVDPRLSPDDRRRVLAHEVGHLVAGHCTPGSGWQYSSLRGQQEPMEAEAELFSRLATGGAR